MRHQQGQPVMELNKLYQPVNINCDTADSNMHAERVNAGREYRLHESKLRISGHFLWLLLLGAPEEIPVMF
jgi:hypothetical protein